MPLPRYILLKNPMQLDTLAIVQFLHSRGDTMCQPVACVERNHPDWATELPAIEICEIGERFVGIKACVEFYEMHSGIPDLLAQALAFKRENARYRIH